MKNNLTPKLAGGLCEDVIIIRYKNRYFLPNLALTKKEIYSRDPMKFNFFGGMTARFSKTINSHEGEDDHDHENDVFKSALNSTIVAGVENIPNNFLSQILLFFDPC